MSKANFTILTFLLGLQILIGQNRTSRLNDWDKIIITDAYSGWSYFENKFQIKSQDFLLTSLEKPDSIIKKIDPNLTSEIVKLIRNTNDTSFKKPLISFGRDSIWLIHNAENLWKEHTKNRKTTKEIDSIAINTIKDYKKANQAASSLEGSNRTDDYPLIVVSVIKGNDTISAYSMGQEPYMLPWYVVKKGKIYDSKLSELVAELLPDKLPNNKERLSGQDFNGVFVQKIYEIFLVDKENYLDAKNAFPGIFKSLEKNFEIMKAEIMDMSSIEWGGNVGSRCLEFSLKDSTISKNIRFNTISGVNEFFSTKKSIIYKKNDLIHSLKENPVYQYTLNCNNCLGEIHWVKSKSLSTKAQNNFKEDLGDSGVDKNKYDGKYKDAIFFELTEHRDLEKSFSRWIFLKDGTLILWQLRGSFLMNLPKEVSENQGYVCKEIKL
jgi:hypothetical protein